VRMKERRTPAPATPASDFIEGGTTVQFVESNMMELVDYVSWLRKVAVLKSELEAPGRGFAGRRSQTRTLVIQEIRGIANRKQATKKEGVCPANKAQQLK